MPLTEATEHSTGDVASPVGDFGNKPYLDRREAAAFLTGLGLTTAPSTLAKLATVGGGPVITYFGIRPRYTPDDLRAWAHSKLSRRKSTSDNGRESDAA